MAIDYERDRLDRGVHGKLVEPICTEHVRPGIGPDIAAVTSMLSELDIVNVLAATVLPDKDQFVLAAVERPHAAIGFTPNDKVLELPVDAPAGGQHLIQMAPIRAHEVDCAVRGVFGANIGQKPFSLCYLHPSLLRRGRRPPPFDLAQRLGDGPQRFARIHVVEQRRTVVERAKNLPAAVDSRCLERLAPDVDRPRFFSRRMDRSGDAGKRFGPAAQVGQGRGGGHQLVQQARVKGRSCDVDERQRGICCPGRSPA